MRLILICVAITLLFQSSYAFMDTTKMNQVQRLMEKSNYEEAYKLATEIRTENPLSEQGAQAAYLAIECLENLKEVDRAIKELKELQQIYSGTPYEAEALIMLGYFYGIYKKDFEQSARYYTQVIEQFPKSEESSKAILGKSQCLMKLGQDAQAVQDLLDLEKAKRGSWIGLMAAWTLADYYQKIGDKKQTKKCHQLIITYYEKFPEWVEIAKSTLAEEESYIENALFDKIFRSVDRYFQKDINEYSLLVRGLALQTTLLIIRLASLAVILLLINIVTRFKLLYINSSILLRKWSINQIVMLLVGICGASFCLGMAWWIIDSYLLVIGSKFSLYINKATVWLFDAIVVFAAAIIILRRESISKIFRVNLRVLLITSAGMLTFIGLIALVSFLNSLWSVRPSGYPIVKQINNSIELFAGDYAAISFVAFYCLIVAVGEETVFRGTVFESFRRKTGNYIGALTSSLLFSLYHVQPFLQSVVIFAFGLLACILYAKTRSLAAPVIVHWLINTLVFVLLIFY